MGSGGHAVHLGFFPLGFIQTTLQTVSQHQSFLKTLRSVLRSSDLL